MPGSHRKLSFQQLESRELLAAQAFDDSYTVNQGEVLVVGEKEASLSSIELRQEYPSFGIASNVAHSASQNMLFIQDPVFHELRVVDLDTSSLLSSATSVAEFTNMSVTPDGRYLFIGDYGGPRPIPENPAKSFVHRFDTVTLTWLRFQLTTAAHEIVGLTGNRIIVNQLSLDHAHLAPELALYDLDIESRTARKLDYGRGRCDKGRIAYDQELKYLYQMGYFATHDICTYRIVDDRIQIVSEFDSGIRGLAPVTVSAGGSWLFHGRVQYEAVDPARGIVREYGENVMAATDTVVIDTEGRYFDSRSGEQIGQLELFNQPGHLSPNGTDFWLAHFPKIRRYELKYAKQGVLENDLAPDPLTAAISALPKHGEVSLNANGSFQYVPSPDFSGIDTFRYLATTATGQQAMAQVEIEVIPSEFSNRKPDAASVDFDLDKDETLSIRGESGQVHSGLRLVGEFESTGNVVQIEYSVEFQRLALRNTATRIQIVDPQTGSVVSEFYAKNSFADMSIAPDGRYLFAAEYSGVYPFSREIQYYIHRYDFRTNQWISKRSPFGTYPIEALSDDRFLSIGLQQGRKVSLGRFGLGDTITTLDELSAWGEGDIKFDPVSNRVYRVFYSKAKIHVAKVHEQEISAPEVIELGATDFSQGYVRNFGLSSDGKTLYWGRHLVAIEEGKVVRILGEPVFAVSDQLVFGKRDIYDLQSGVRIGLQDYVSEVQRISPDGEYLWTYDPKQNRLKQFALDGQRHGLLAHAWDPEGNALQMDITSAPSQGILSPGVRKGELSYQPNRGFTGVDRFTFRATDGHSFSDPRTVTIRVHDVSPVDAPPIAKPEQYQVGVGEILTIGQSNDPIFVTSPEFALDETPSTIAMSVRYGFFAVGTDTGVQVFDIETKQLISRLDSQLPIRDLDLTPDGRYLFALEFAGYAEQVGKTNYAHRYDIVSNSWISKESSRASGLKAVSANKLVMQMVTWPYEVALFDFPEAPLAHLVEKDSHRGAHRLGRMEYDPYSSRLYYWSDWNGPVSGFLVSGDRLLPMPVDWKRNYARTQTTATFGSRLYVGPFQYSFDTNTEIEFAEPILAATADFAIGSLGLYSTTSANRKHEFPEALVAATTNRAGTLIGSITQHAYSTVETAYQPSGILENDIDPDGHALRPELLAEPAHGALELHPDGSFQYIPEIGFVGSDYFVYRAVSGDSKSSAVSVQIDVLGTWHNTAMPLDVNDDQIVSPIDALTVIQALNFPDPSAYAHANQDFRFLDVSNDGILSPMDALLVINYLNRRATAEGESQIAADVYFGDLESPHSKRLRPRCISIVAAACQELSGGKDL